MLQKKKRVSMTNSEKIGLCDSVPHLTEPQTKTFLGVLTTGMDDESIKEENMLEVDVDKVYNATLRELQMFVQSPDEVTDARAQRNGENEIANIETCKL